MIVLAVRRRGTLLAAKSYFQCTKKWSRRTRGALRSIISNFKNSYQPENAKKNSSYRHFELLSICMSQKVSYLLKTFGPFISLRLTFMILFWFTLISSLFTFSVFVTRPCVPLSRIEHRFSINLKSLKTQKQEKNVSVALW